MAGYHGRPRGFNGGTRQNRRNLARTRPALQQFLHSDNRDQTALQPFVGLNFPARAAPWAGASRREIFTNKEPALSQESRHRGLFRRGSENFAYQDRAPFGHRFQRRIGQRQRDQPVFA